MNQKIFLSLIILIVMFCSASCTLVLADFQQQALKEHNLKRNLHCTRSLVLNSTINTIAQNYANYLAANNLFQHSGAAGLGENLWALSSSAVIPSVNGSWPTDSWYSEISRYNYSSPGYSSSTGHFTQVIWTKSTQLGIGIAFSSNNQKAYVVANYYPAGNVDGNFATDVLPLCSESTTTVVTITSTQQKLTSGTSKITAKTTSAQQKITSGTSTTKAKTTSTQQKLTSGTSITTVKTTTSSNAKTNSHSETKIVASTLSTTVPTSRVTASANTVRTTSVSTTVPSANGFTSFQEQALKEHNLKRKLHCTGSLALNSTINTIAQNYANYLAANNLFQHSGAAGLGENLWAMWSSAIITSVNGSSPTDSWYNEISSYNYKSPGFSSSTGHFTQVIWAKSTQLGIGIAFSSNKQNAYVVANYYPAGNVVGSFATNVLPLC